MRELAQALTAALLHFVWQGLMVAVLLWVVLLILKKRSPSARYLASCVSLLVLAALPAVTAFRVYRPPVPARAGVRFVAATVEPAVSDWRRSDLPAAWLSTIDSWALPVWSFGVLVFSVRLIWGSRQVYMLRRRGEPAGDRVLALVSGLATRMGLMRPVRVLISSAAEGPSVVGWIRPLILLPAATLLALTSQQLEAVLAHEIAHIRRYDYLVNTLQLVVEALLFYHPAVWWTSARIRHERELCCDDLAVRSCGDALCYARALTTLERRRVLAPSLALGSTDGPLLFRIQRLVGAETQEQMPSKLPGIVALSLAVACLALNINWARAQAPGQKSELVRTELASAPQVRDARGVQVDFGGAAVLHRTPVEYPEAAIAKDVQGTVVVEATLDARGVVDDARVLSGPPELRKGALTSVLNWHFLPDAGGAGSKRQVSIAFQLAAVEVSAEQRGVKTADEEREYAGRVFFFSSGLEPGNGESKGIAELEATVRELREQLEKLHAMQATAQQQEASKAFPQIEKQLQERLADAQRGLEHDRQRNTSLAGRKLRSIRVRGLSSQGLQELSSQLPIHMGDTLSKDLIEETGRAIRAFDEHLEFRVIPLEGGEADLEIDAPGERR